MTFGLLDEEDWAPEPETRACTALPKRHWLSIRDALSYQPSSVVGKAVQARVSGSGAQSSASSKPKATAAAPVQAARAAAPVAYARAPVITTAPAKDPDAMDVDSSRSRFKGQCFRCRKFGHRANDCPASQQEVIRALEQTPEPARVSAATLPPATTAPTPESSAPVEAPDFQSGP